MRQAVDEGLAWDWASSLKKERVGRGMGWWPMAERGEWLSGCGGCRNHGGGRAGGIVAAVELADEWGR
jgi:sugar phosphate permease